MNICAECGLETVPGHVHYCIAALKAERDALKLQVSELRKLMGHWSTVELALKAQEETNRLLSEAKTLIADWLQHECSVGGPSWEEIESRARAMVADKPECAHAWRNLEPVVHDGEQCQKCLAVRTKLQKRERPAPKITTREFPPIVDE